MKTQPAFTCSSLTKEALGKSVKYVQTQQLKKKNENGANDIALVSLELTFGVPAVEFEQEIPIVFKSCVFD